jgi:hypothetical protein
MILVRNIFRLKFGKAKEAVAIWKEGRALNKKLGLSEAPIRILTDLTGPSYTLMMEVTHESLADFERLGKQVMAAPEWQSWYQKFVPLVESGAREIFTIVE